MSYQLILSAQKFSYRLLVGQFDGKGNLKKRVFFQAELRPSENNSFKFGMVAYPAWKKGKAWIVGDPISGENTGEEYKVTLENPVAFANNEIELITSRSKKKKKNKKNNKERRRGKWSAIMKKAEEAATNPDDLEKAYLVFKSGISKNPHVEYSASINVGETNIPFNTKPSPPAPPEA